MDRKSFRFQVLGMEAFTLLETLVAIVIFSIGLMAVSSISITMVGSNRVSKHYLEASVVAQSQMEALRNTGFKLDSNGNISSSASYYSGTSLINVNAGNDAVTDPATMFANPDHAYTVAANGTEVNPILDSPSGLAPTINLRRVWVVRDNLPAPGMKSVSVIVGWEEGRLPAYVVVSSAIQGK